MCAFADRQRGFPATPLAFDSPRVRDAVRELTYLLRTRAADVLITHSFKPNVLGGVAAGSRWGHRTLSSPPGWTGESLKVRMYEAMDRYQLRSMPTGWWPCPRAKAKKVRRCGVDPGQVVVIRNAARPEAFVTAGPRIGGSAEFTLSG